MGIHTSIYRERFIPVYEKEKYQIRLFEDDKEIKLDNAVSLREEFYFGKSVWHINEWFYQLIKKRDGDGADPDLSYEWIYEEYIYLSDLKQLLGDIKQVLENPELAEKILPMPHNLELVRQKVPRINPKTGNYIVKAGDEWEKVPREEMYDEYYFETLKRAKELLEQLIAGDNNELVSEYLVDIG